MGEAHKTRVRCMTLLSDTKLVTASSCDGFIKVWNIAADGTTPVTLCCSINTQCRITCITTWFPAMREVTRKAKKRKKVEIENKKVESDNDEEVASCESSEDENTKSEEVIKKKVKLPEVKATVNPSSSIKLIEEEELDDSSKPKEKSKNKKKKKKASTAETSVG